MPRSVDEDAVPVIVPRNAKPLVPVAPDRARRLRKHVVKALRDARVLKNVDPPCPPPPTGFAARVAGTACGLCRGWCCRNGRDDAFLDDHAMARVRRDRPELSAGAVLQLYASRVPTLAHEDSCIFHSGKGCTLDRALRADICNSYFCGGMTAYLRDRQRDAPRVVIAGEGHGMRTSAVLVP